LDIDVNRNIFYNLELDINTLYWQYLIVTNKYKNMKAPLTNKYYKFIKNRIVLDNGNLPIILHGNGDTNMDKIVQYLGYPISIKDNKDYFTYSIKPYIKLIKNKHPIFTNSIHYSIKLIHIIIALYVYLFVFYTNNKLQLSILILFIYMVTLQWYLIGNCFLSNIENLFSDNNIKLKNNKEYSFFLKPLINLFGENCAHYSTTCAPLIILLIALYKINKK
jgi:hypothetical protein